MTTYITKLYDNPQEVKHLNLSQNEIRNIPPLGHFKYLSAIDLCFNNIQTTESLEPLKVLSKSLRSISLHGNPVCSVFFTAQQYVQFLIKILPNLSTIDSQAINAKDFRKDEFFSSKRNYLCSLDGYDFVESFVESFFETWNNERDKLKYIIENFYHEKATLTLSFTFKEKVLSTPRYELNLRKNHKLSRNLTSDVSSWKDKVYYGSSQLSCFFKEFNSTTVIFDIPTFAIDLAVFNVTSLIHSYKLIINVVDFSRQTWW